MIKIEKGYWWFKNSKVKFLLDKFYIENFNDLKKIFKFSNQNFEIVIRNQKIKKIGYNFFLNGKKVVKNDVVKLLKNML